VNDSTPADKPWSGRPSVALERAGRGRSGGSGEQSRGGGASLTADTRRLRHDAGWTTHAVDGGHNLMRDAPEDLLRILLDVPGPR
jgi:hypothetical protein